MSRFPRESNVFSYLNLCAMKNFLWVSNIGQNRLRREKGPFNVIKITHEGKLLTVAKSDYSKTFL